MPPRKKKKPELPPPDLEPAGSPFDPSELLAEFKRREEARKSKAEAAAPAEVVPTPLPDLDEPFVTKGYLERVKALLAERARRRVESVRLYEPLESQRAFHASSARERLLRGSNRGGKTLPAAVEVARAVSGLDPHGKYPRENGRAFLVGRDERHLGDVMWWKLSRAGAFKMIRDRATGEWRAYRPWEDADRKSEARPAPPLIPHRLIRDIGWFDKKSGVPKKVILHNGWEITFFSSNAKPPRGSDIDLVWFDEEILDGEWYSEMSARLIDRGGRFFWSATPQSGTEQLLALHDQAEAQRYDPEPRVTEHLVLLDNNPYLDEADKKSFAETLSEADYEVRYKGEFAIISYRVYPEFTPAVHGSEAFEIPPKWTRWVSIDPGRQVCAVLFLAVPPPHEDPHLYLYDELYIKNCSAQLFGQELARKSAGQQLHAMIIDWHGSRITEAGSGLTIEQQYAMALVKEKVTCTLTGSNFLRGSDDVAGGIEAFRAWLLGSGTAAGPRLRVFEQRCPNFVEEIKKYRYKREGGLTTDKPETRGAVHLMACARYLAMARPVYAPPPAKGPPPSAAYAAYQRKLERLKQQTPDQGVIYLGSAVRSSRL